MHKHNVTLATVLSLLIPGFGQIYNHDILRGIFWLIVTPGMWIGTGGQLGWICHFIAAYTAYKRAVKIVESQTAKSEPEGVKQ